MENVSQQADPQPDPSLMANQRVEAASEFLSICDGTGRPAPIYWL